MWSRLSIVVGLLGGVVVAGLLYGGILLAGPGPSIVPAATPTAAAPQTPSSTGSADPSSAAPSGEPTPSSSADVRIGEPAPALAVPRVGGGTIDLATLRGQAVWVEFIGTDCAPCRDEVPLMQDFATRYAEDGLVVLVVAVDEDEGAAANLANELGITFPLGLDQDGTVAASWGATTPPVHVWIDADGVVRDSASGGIGVDRMAAGVQSILPDVEVTLPEPEATPSDAGVTS